ncbi:hypothetical protein HORIV_33340 [Vreelandella olivaria]|uniref:Uncharacterized protein n=1 Tax=Vreelandella olivaria TaxID=390919 RepID=A0ABM7GJS1_9GAMM|nr:hypothetical protein HORIV_33340 [Halomonas olivaria]
MALSALAEYGKAASDRHWFVCAAGCAGVANVLLWLPLWLALLHTAGAIALAVGLVWAWWRWRYQEADVYATTTHSPYNNVIAH